jgi:hypothetical protein
MSAKGRRVALGHGLNGVFLIVFAFFAGSILGLGLLVAVFSERLAAAVEGSSATAYYVFGAVLTLLGLGMARGALRGFGAVGVIDVDADGTWTLKTRFGRTLAVVPAEQARRLELCGGVVLIVVAVPRRQPVVDGRLHLPGLDRSFRLAASGPYTYDRALAALGYEQAAPRPGERVVIG